MMLDGDDIDSLLVAQHELVKGFLEQVSSDLWITILIWQTGPDGIRTVEHVLWDEGIRVLVVIPGFHDFFPPQPTESLLFQEGNHMINEGFGLLDLRMVSRLGEELEARARNQRAVGPSVGRCHDPVARPPQY